MRNLIFTLILSLFLIFLTLEANAQGDITVRLKMPPAGKLNIKDFWAVTLINNTGNEQSVYLVGTATEEKDGLIARGTTVPFKLKTGTTILKLKDLPKTPDVEYTARDQRYKEALIRTGEFPSGIYEICVYVKYSKNKEDAGSDCFTQTVKEEGILSLINPADEQEIDLKTPLIFTWSYSGKMPADGYTLKIVEVKKGQTPETAIKSNRAFFEKERIKSTTFSYPASALKFEEGKKYAWGVKGEGVTSEIFTLEISELKGTGPVISLTPTTGNCCYKMSVWQETGSYFSSFKFTSSNIASATSEPDYSIINKNLPTNFVLKRNVGLFPIGSSFVGTVCFDYSTNPFPITVVWSTNGGANWTNSFDTTIVCESIPSGDVGQCDKCDTCFREGDELITNGTFGAGNTGFSSDLTFNLSSIMSPGDYSVRNSSNLVNPQWACNNHTPSGNGNFFVCDNSITSGTIAWEQSITVKKEKEYLFCAWVNNLVPPPPAANNYNDPIINVTINDVTFITGVTIPETPDAWTALTGTWTAPINTTTAKIKIYSSENESGGDDFALDDISFKECIPITADAGPDITVLVGGTVTLNGSGGASCLWTPSTHLNDATLCTPLFTAPPTPGPFTYILNAMDGNIICDTDTLIITVDSTTTQDSCKITGYKYLGTTSTPLYGWNIQAQNDINIYYGSTNFYGYFSISVPCGGPYTVKEILQTGYTYFSPTNGTYTGIYTSPGTPPVLIFRNDSTTTQDSCHCLEQIDGTTITAYPNSQNPQKYNLQCNGLYTYAEIKNQPLGITTSIHIEEWDCAPVPNCDDSYSWSIVAPHPPNASNTTQDFNYTFNYYGTYIFQYEVKCGSKTCRSCTDTIIIDSCYCQEPFDNTIITAYPNSQNPHKYNPQCNSSYTLTHSTPIPTYIHIEGWDCAPDPNCEDSHSWWIDPPIQPIKYGTTQDFSYTFSDYGTYTFHYEIWCGMEKCRSCTNTITIVPDSCNCGGWTLKAPIEVVMKNGKSKHYLCNSTHYVKNKGTYISSIKVTGYQCNPNLPSCPLEYTWKIKDMSNNVLQLPGSGSVIKDTDITVPLPKKFKVIFYTWCGGKKCEKCKLKIINEN